MRYRTLILTTLAAAALLACGGTAPPAPVPSPKPPTSAQVQAALQAANEPISGWTDYTTETDVNHLLGRPHQYIAKLSWHDTRITTEPAQPNALAVDDGGGVEIFASTTDRAARLSELQRLAASPLFAEYDYSIGQFLILRVSHKLTPDQAEGYQRALSSLK
jgi:hypothetical protein